MAQLTKEHFDEQVQKLVTKTELGAVLDEKLDQRFEDQAVLINNAFQSQKDYMDEKFTGIDLRFDKVEERLGSVEIKLDRALYTELVHLETRLRRVEEKVGIKP